MKIVYLLSHVPGPRFYKKMKKAKEEFEVSVIFRNKNSEDFQTFFYDQDINKYEIINSNLKPWKIPFNLYFAYIKNAMSKLKIINPQIIHCANLDMLLVSAIYKTLINKEVKIVYEIGDLNKRTFNNSRKINKLLVKKMLFYIESKLTSKVELLVISSQYFWDDYYKIFFPKEKTFLFPNAPERKIFESVKENEENVITIGFIGRVRYYDQMKMLIDVVNKINTENNKRVFKVFIAGVGPESQKLIDYTANFNFVELYGSYNYENEIASIYSKVDFVYSVYDAKIPNVKIAIPNRLDEAIVSEKPIIVAKDTKLEEFVLKNQIGFSVSSENEQGLLNLLRNISLGKVNVNAIKTQCHQIKYRFYIDSYQEQLLNLYKALIR